MADLDSALAAVVYYAWEGHYHHMATVLADQLHRFGSDPLLLYWRAFGLVMEERLSDGMAELNQLQDAADLQLATSLLLIYAHKQCKIIDKETVKKLETGVRGYRSTAGEKAMYYGAITLWLLRKHDKAREYTEKLLQRVAPKSVEGKIVRGWVDLTSDRENLVKKSIKYFDDAIQSSTSTGPPPLLAVLGKARFYISRYNFKAAMDVLQRAVSTNPAFLPGLIEKMRVELANQQWDSATETANRCLSVDGNCIEAVKLLALDQCVRKGNMDGTADLLEKLTEQLDHSEPHSHQLYYDISLGFARMAEGHSAILQHTQTLVERAISLKPSCADYTIELAHQYLLKEQLQDGLIAYRRAFTMDEMSIAAMMGLLHCQLLMGKTTEAEQQLEFLNELQPGSASQSYLSYLNALLSASKGVADDSKGVADDSKGVADDIIINQLTTAATTHFNGLKGKHLSYEYFKMANPDYVYRLADTMMRYTSSESTGSTSILQAVVTILDPLAHTAPGLSRTMLLLARVKYLLGESDVALTISQQCASHAHCTVESLLLQATIHHHHGNMHKSEQALETALSNNFEVQQTPLYHLLKGRISFSQGNMATALTSLQSAVGLIRSPPKSKATPTNLPLSQQVTAYIELVHTLSALGDQDQAASIMQETTKKFTGTSEEARVTISSADLALTNSNIPQALQLLQQITQDKPYYIQAREKMAEVYLVQYSDKQRYLQCYQQLADTLTGSPTATLLGDAYLNVNEPDQALSVFERALRKSPRDAVLASRVGQVLVRTHQYGKAINYYETSLKSTNLPSLRSDLADLYLRLSQYDKAVRTLQTGLEHGPTGGGEDLEQLMEDVQYSMLLARAHTMSGDTTQAVEVLHSAQNIQSRVVHKVSVEQPELMAAQQRLTASICCQLAELAISESHDLTAAVHSYDQALSHDPNNTLTQLAAARLMMMRGLMEDCEQHCTTILQHDPNNEDAIVLMADLLHQRGEVDAAITQLSNILDKKPNHFEALVRLIEMCWRKGVVSDASNILNMVEQRCSGHVIHQAGLMYCKGLYSQYIGDTELALRSYNNARKDSEWGERALGHMIVLCLNPDNDILGAETLKPVEHDSNSSSSSERFDAEMMAVRTAEKLLKEVRPHSAAGRLKVQLLENSILLATRSKQNAEKALTNYTKLLTTEREGVAILAGMATAHLQLKQVPRARNQLKRVSKLAWSLEEGAEFERSWLLMADVYIQSGKYDIAIDHLKKCIARNESCSKAWEYLGFIAEKEQAFKDAADHYEKAWRHSHCRSPAVGYRLAFNYLKARKYVEAVEVCHKVLHHHPTYPRIRKDVLDKARHNIRL